MLARYVAEQDGAGLNVDAYLNMCEQLGQEPDPNRMPLDISDFPTEMQVAFFISSLLSDRWDGASGNYLGKDWAPIAYLLKLYEVEYPKTVIYLMKLYEGELISYRAKKHQKELEKQKRAQKAQDMGNRKYTHNVKG